MCLRKVKDRFCINDSHLRDTVVSDKPYVLELFYSVSVLTVFFKLFRLLSVTLCQQFLKTNQLIPPQKIFKRSLPRTHSLSQIWTIDRYFLENDGGKDLSRERSTYICT